MEFSFNHERASDTAKLRILMQNRNNALTQPGGDTVVMQRIAEALRAKGHIVDFDFTGQQDPKGYSLVHLFNFVTNKVTEYYARRSKEAGVPYVVTTMYEDWPVFFSQMHAMAGALQDYVRQGQSKAQWFSLRAEALAAVPHGYVDNTWTAANAGALIATGAYEAETLRRYYPQASCIETYSCGCDVIAQADKGEMFRRETGLSDFILCVGRIEPRKNQLMLLKALEDSDLTLVFAGSDFTYDPRYDEACRVFRRKGRSIFLGKLSPEMLASAYGACRVHALPSWFELPGLVTIEAARYGANLVTSDFGTQRDYLGNYAFYCRPDDEDSINNAVLAAYYSPLRMGLKEHAAKFTWENAAERCFQIYLQVLSNAGVDTAPYLRTKPQQWHAQTALEKSAESIRACTDGMRENISRIPQAITLDNRLSFEDPQINDLCDRGDAAFARGLYEEANHHYLGALQIDPDFSRAFRGQGVVQLSAGQLDQAKQSFGQALRINPKDTKALLGLGAAAWAEGKKQEAFSIYLRASESEGDGDAAVLHLVNAAYELKRYAELESALRRMVNRFSGNLDIQYCLAGCYFIQEKYSLACGVLEHLLQVNPAYHQALELKEEINSRRSNPAQAAPSEVASLLSPQSETNDHKTRFKQAQTVAARLQIIEELRRKHEFGQAEALCAEVLSDVRASASELAWAKILQAECLGSQGDIFRADNLFAQAEGDLAFGHRALCGRGALAAALSKWQEAEALFQRALLIKPDYDAALAGLGICAQNTNQQTKAWGYYEVALRMNPENVQALYGMVPLAYSLGRLAALETVLRNYLEIVPVELNILYTLAGCLYAQGNLEEATEHCRTILLFQPGDERAAELLAMIEEREARQSCNQQR